MQRLNPMRVLLGGFPAARKKYGHVLSILRQCLAPRLLLKFMWRPFSARALLSLHKGTETCQNGMKAMTTTKTAPAQRIDWVDYARGISIILVVMLHSSLGVQKVLEDCTWFGYLVAWAQPFRVPAFFLISGLFLARRVNWPWRDFLDRRVVHFAYFYVLWLIIAFTFKAPVFMKEFGVEGTLRLFATSFIDPFGSLWFIYLLAIFAVAVKLLRNVAPWVVWPVAALLEALPIHTGWMVPDEFAARFVYFYTGYIAAPHVFRFADAARRLTLPALFAALLGWALFEALMVFADVDGRSLATLPGVSLALGLAGSLAVAAAGVWMARAAVFGFVRLVGQRTLIVYVAFFLFMATARTILVKVAPWLGADIISTIVLAAAITGPLVMHRMVRNTPLRFLFERPAAFHLPPSDERRMERRVHDVMKHA